MSSSLDIHGYWDYAEGFSVASNRDKGGGLSFTGLGSDNIGVNASYSVAIRSHGAKASEVLHRLNREGIPGLWSTKSDLVAAALDQIDNRLILYRDPIGRYPLYWRRESHSLHWSTTIEELLPAQPKLNLSYFSRYFVSGGLVDLWPETPFTGIHRVPRGNAIAFGMSQPPITLYVDRLRPLHREGDLKEADVYDRFRDILSHIVRNHAESGALFECSGGLDSTALLIANELGGSTDAAATTFVFDRYPECDERENAQSIAKRTATSWHSINADNLLPMGLSEINEKHLSEEPCLEMSLYAWRLPPMQLASELGYQYVFSGFGGNHLLDGNGCFIADLLKKGKAVTAWRQAWMMAAKKPEFGRTSLSILMTYGILPILGIEQKEPVIRARRDPINSLETLAP